MAADKATVQVGSAKVEVDLSDLHEHIAAVEGGAARQFVDTVSEGLSGLVAVAKTRWPVRTGRSRDSFRIRAHATADEVSVRLANAAQNRWGFYAYKIRWSVRTHESLEREIKDKALHAGGTPRAWAYWRARVTRTHGKGAPDEQTAGKRPWSVLITKPAKKLTDRLVDDLEEALVDLAKEV